MRRSDRDREVDGWGESYGEVEYQPRYPLFTKVKGLQPSKGEDQEGRNMSDNTTTEVVREGFYRHRAVRVLGESPKGMACIEYVNAEGWLENRDTHAHVPAAEVTSQRYPEVEVQLTGEDGNVFFILGRVRKALRRAGYSETVAEEFVGDITDSESYEDALTRVRKWVSVR